PTAAEGGVPPAGAPALGVARCAPLPARLRVARSTRRRRMRWVLGARRTTLVHRGPTPPRGPREPRMDGDTGDVGGVHLESRRRGRIGPPGAARCRLKGFVAQLDVLATVSGATKA